jgi:hypothetical protein
MRTVATAALLISLIVSASIPGSVLAEPRPTDVSRMVTDDCALARKAGKTCVLDVQAEDVDGKVPTVDDLAVRILTFGKAGSLIRVRRDFIPEIVKAADDL